VLVALVRYAQAHPAQTDLRVKLVPFSLLAAVVAQEMTQGQVTSELVLVVVQAAAVLVSVVLVAQVFQVKETMVEIRVSTSAPVVVVPVRWGETARPVSVVPVVQVWPIVLPTPQLLGPAGRVAVPTVEPPGPVEPAAAGMEQTTTRQVAQAL